MELEVVNHRLDFYDKKQRENTLDMKQDLSFLEIVRLQLRGS